ncbi:SDR family oxidoreductase [Aquibacillus sp. 3ASR75-11]|uniref:SDR family oxidoreductase n=1 Tax=Terrihalobacillus insolitus TaxID=2950438 RepID=A0A9X3WSY9_9BACI|nr:SDR family oxidoreductase [Terrihalobacillus insolitus]MDC3412036.1 SDR family oxidoreductase [Terrihalobacillus insolitus]MDC3423271.1 SDR family oxidoreductase [Terrihalobacillus insolitus]
MKMLQDKLAVVTGVSHDKGIGAAVCRRFAADGLDIFFSHWKADSDWVLSFKKELIEIGVRVDDMEIDLSMRDSSTVLLDQVNEKLGKPTILVNNAAHSLRDGYKQLNAQLLDDHYAVNMRATLLLSVEFTRRFEQSPLSFGRIINLTSGQAKGPMLEELAYGATKGAVSAFTLSLSAEVAHLGITVNAVNPGPTDTGWMTEEVKKELKPKFLSGRVGVPEDAAKLVSFLASEDAGWVTGQVIDSEGAFLRS